jgi:5'(3')-deoxyribonucleotidase
MAMSKKTLFVDMDNVIADFKSGLRKLPHDVEARHAAMHGRNELGEPNNADEIFGVFALMEPVPGAVEAIFGLAAHFDIYALSTSPWNNPSAWSDKLLWIQKHFGREPDSPLYKRLILSHHKHLSHGHFLVDDRLVNGAREFGERENAEHIHFGQHPFEDWSKVLEYLLARA